jgi:hypothetical protein
MGPGSELEPAKCGEVLSGNVYRPSAAAEIVRDREAINIRALRGRKLRDSRFQARSNLIPSAVKSIGFTEIGRLGVGPLWNYVSYALGPRIIRAARQLFIREPF